MSPINVNSSALLEFLLGIFSFYSLFFSFSVQSDSYIMYNSMFYIFLNTCFAQRRWNKCTRFANFSQCFMVTSGNIYCCFRTKIRDVFFSEIIDIEFSGTVKDLYCDIYIYYTYTWGMYSNCTVGYVFR